MMPFSTQHEETDPMNEKYQPQEIEEKWQRRWDEAQVFAARAEDDRPTFYIVEMLAYTSGRAHMGHVENYSIGDALAWYKRLRGYNVFHPFGWDAFGQPAEEAAIKNNVAPEVFTAQSIENMRRQLKRLGVGYDWSSEIATCDPEYYKWNQWFFIEMWKRGLIYRKFGPLNWCPKESIVLSNEQAEGGKCWRCGSEVIQKEMEQWFARITDYANQLLDDMEQIEEGWPEGILTSQREWIGRSYGADVEFGVDGRDDLITVFTTRIDTIFGVTAVMLAPEHPLVDALVGDDEERKEAVASMRAEKRDARTLESLEKRGVETGSYAINPFNAERVPIWVANYILMEYGTGAVMSVPGHDERDFEFSRSHGLPIRRVVAPAHVDPGSLSDEVDEPLAGDGVLVNSGTFSGLDTEDAIREMTEYAERNGIGARRVRYRLKDWTITRQRYWGTPVPMVHCPECGVVPVPEDQLPVVLPLGVAITGERGSPLDHVPEFVNTTCPSCGKAARRDTDTMDTFVDSSWYFFRYCDPHNDQAPFDPEKVARWFPIDHYVGGKEHANMHLIYCRFWTKFMRDIGLVTIDEPALRLLNQGMVCMYSEKKGAVLKMSKSLGNVVEPDEMFERFGADATRLYVLFASPPEKDMIWEVKRDEAGEVEYPGIEGAFRYLARVWRLFHRWVDKVAEAPKPPEELSAAQRAVRRKTHQTIRRATEAFEDRLRLNTVIAALMELTNTLYEFTEATPEPDEADRAVVAEALSALTKMLVPFAPHVASELWEQLGHKAMLADTSWPVYRDELAREEEVEIPVQVNGKLRSKILVAPDVSQEALREAALADEKVRSFVDGKEIAKVIVVPGRLVNVVVR
jgi:leucyl-tRNA synthetase